MAFVKFIFVLLLVIPVAFLMLYLLNKANSDIPEDGMEDFSPRRRSARTSSSNNKSSNRRSNAKKNRKNQRQSGKVKPQAMPRQTNSTPANDWSSRLSHKSGIEPPLSMQRGERKK